MLVPLPGCVRELRDSLFLYVSFPTEPDSNAAAGFLDRSDHIDLRLNFRLLLHHRAPTGSGAAFYPFATRIQRGACRLGHQRAICGHTVEPTHRRAYGRLGWRQVHDLFGPAGMCR